MSRETTRREFLAIAAGAGTALAIGAGWNVALAEKADLSRAKLLHRIDCTQELPPEKYFGLGEVKVVESSAGRYREAQGTPPHARFGYRFAIEHIGRPHVAVIRYPDDKQRYMCIMDGTCYDLTTGVYTGWAQPISGTMLELRQIFWPRWKDNSIVFMTWNAGEPAAAASVEIYELDDLPPLPVPGDRGDGSCRELGIQYEDPCGTGASEGAKTRAEWIDRIVQYTRHTGQNLLAYPMAWYHGPQCPVKCEPNDGFDWVVAEDRKQYTRWTTTPADWYATLLERFGKEGLQFQGAMTLMRLGSLLKKMNIDLGAIRGGTETFNNMRSDNQVQTSTNDWTPIYNCLNYRAVTELNKDKKPLEPWIQSPPVWAYGERRNNPGWIGPMFNPLHPAVQEAILALVKELGEHYGKYPAFKGISFNMFLSAMPWFGTIQFGYDDYSVALFEKETDITVPIDAKAADRFSQRYAFLTEKHRSEWIAWRCKKIRELFGRIHKTLAAARPDLRVTVTLWDETVVFELGYPMEGLQFGARKQLVELYREGGIDVDLYRDEPGLELDRGMGNSRDRGGHWSTPETVYRDGDFLEQDSIDAFHNLDCPGAFIFNCWVEAWGQFVNFRTEDDDSNVAQIRIMDGKPAEGIFRTNSEYPKDDFWWNSQERITPGFQGGVHFLEPYAAAVADLDACRITRGGLFMDKAHTEAIQQFAKAYRALPKKKFAAVGKTTDPVCVRTLVQNGRRYFYAVNRDYYPVKVEMTFSAAAKAEDVATGEKFDLSKQWSFVLGPYELRSIAIPPDVEVSSFTATPPEEIAQKLRQEVEQTLALFAKLRSAGKTVPGADKLEERMRAALAENKLAWLRRAMTSYVVRKSRAISG
jgi:hypothetical protein